MADTLTPPSDLEQVGLLAQPKFPADTMHAHDGSVAQDSGMGWQPYQPPPVPIARYKQYCVTALHKSAEPQPNVPAIPPVVPPVPPDPPLLDDAPPVVELAPAPPLFETPRLVSTEPPQAIATTTQRSASEASGTAARDLTRAL